MQCISTGEEIESAVNVEEVLGYFVVHNFVCNGDSYTGSMVHNYYLYEEDGRLSMIPWDYNLAFGTFQAGDASSAVNSPIDTPVSDGDLSARPMLNWIFTDEAYTALYHQYFEEFLAQTDLDTLISETAALIAPYVECDPTKFYSAEEFERGTAALREFCRLRTQSVQGQLKGSIPTTAEGQRQAGAALINTAGLVLSEMGSMGGVGGMGNMGGRLPGGQEEMRSAEENLPAALPAFAPGAAEETLPSPPDPATAPGAAAGEGKEDETPGGMGMPDGGREQGLPFAGAPGTTGSAGTAAGPQTAAAGALVLLALSAGALLAGLLFALRFRR